MSRPGLTLQPAAYRIGNLGGLGRTSAAFYARPGLRPNFGYPRASLYTNHYRGARYGGNPYGDYPYSYWPDANSAALYASSEVINAQGQFLVNQQQAYQMRERYRQARLETRRKTLDEYLYERELMPTAEADRQRNLHEQVLRSLNNPPVTEVYSGLALNTLLGDLRQNLVRQQGATLRTYALPLDEAALRHINVTKGPGNLSILKNDGRLTWPAALTGPEFKEWRYRIDSLVSDGLRQASFGNTVDGGTIKALLADASQLRQELRRTGRDLSPALYLSASNYLNKLDDAIRALQQPDISNFVNDKYALKARTVPELVKFLKDNGLQIAPAAPGDESAYLALHQALAAYDRAMQPQAAER
jgi:hypothetical protein